MPIDSVFIDAIDLWGEEAQLDVVIEECAELIKAICKRKRGDAFAELSILEKAVEVTIMIEQLKVMYGIGEFDVLYTDKLNKIREHIRNSKEIRNGQARATKPNTGW